MPESPPVRASNPDASDLQVIAGRNFPYSKLTLLGSARRVAWAAKSRERACVGGCPQPRGSDTRPCCAVQVSGCEAVL